MSKQTIWTMPSWAEKYRRFIVNTGGNEVEELMNDHKSNIVVNAPRAMLCVAVESQIALLSVLHSRNMLASNQGE